MPPDAFMFDTSGQLVMQTAIGGAGTLFGPLVGASVWLYLSDFFQNTLASRRDLEARARASCSCCWCCFLRRGIVGAIGRPLWVGGGRRKTTERARTTTVSIAVASRSSRRRGDAWRAAALRGRHVGTDSPCDRANQALWRLDGQQRYRFRRRTRRNPRHNRAERGRQKHLFQDVDLRDAADVGQDRIRRPRHHGHERHRRLPARAHQELPDQPAVRSPDRPAEPQGRRAGPDPRQVQARSVPQSKERSRPRRTRRTDAGACQSDRAAGLAGLRARLRRKTPARDRPRARDVAEPASARRAACRHEPARTRRDGRPAQIHRARPNDDHHRSRHGLAVRAG